MSIRLIATDLDGTLLADPDTISPRNKEAVRAAQEAGLVVVPVTARQPLGLRPIAEMVGFNSWALCGNGTLGIHLQSGEELFARELDAAPARRIADQLAARIPGIAFASVRDGGREFVAEAAYAAMATYADHKREVSDMTIGPREEVLGHAHLKLIARHEQATNDELLALARTFDLDGVSLTHSGAPFIELMAPGVSKASGLELLCRRLGIAREEVFAFGDAPNDAQMLAWAGRGVAVANACEEARNAAREVTAANIDDGVAQVIEALLAAV